MSKITGRCWAFCVYPDSLPSNYEEIITNTGLPMCFSPLHDKDVEEDGSIKKAHYHVICYYENPTTENNVKINVCDKLHGTIPLKLENMRGMYRYHIHLDSPNKFQYDDRDRRFFNGFDKNEVEKLTSTQILRLKRDIISIIKEKDFYEYSDLTNFLDKKDLVDMLDVCVSNTMFFTAYLNSKRNKLKDSSRYIEHLCTIPHKTDS